MDDGAQVGEIEYETCPRCFATAVRSVLGTDLPGLRGHICREIRQIIKVDSDPPMVGISLSDGSSFIIIGESPHGAG